MGWFDGFTVASLGALAPAWPGMREQLESALLRQKREEQEIQEETEEEESEED